MDICTYGDWCQRPVNDSGGPKAARKEHCVLCLPYTALRLRGAGASLRGSSMRALRVGPEMSCLRPVRLFHAMATAGTIVTVEYVPARTPMRRIQANS